MERTRGTPWLTVAVVLASVCGALLSVGAASAAATHTPSAAPTPGFGVHCNVVVRSENLANDAVQLAINGASAGQTVCVGPGTFPEQLTISKPLSLVGAGSTKTFIMPNTVTFNTVDWDSAPYAGGVTCGTSTCVPLAAIILVESATPPPAASPILGVTIRNLQVNGAPASSDIACGDDYVGVDFQDAGGSLIGSAVAAVASPLGVFGCQEVSGAVYAYNAYFYSSVTPSPAITVTVTATSVTAYQKNGITCDDPGEMCVLTRDTVVGIGPTSLTAQNGIQIAYGASAHLRADNIGDDAYIGSGSTLDWYGTGYQGAGILLYQAGTGTTVLDCTVSQNAMGITGVDDVSDLIQGNRIIDSTGYAIVENGNPATTATIVNNAIGNPVDMAVGILVDNGTFWIDHNSFFRVSPSGTQGGSQPVTGPGSIYPSAPAASVQTAAIQAVSEGGPTSVYAFANLYAGVSTRIATLEVFAGVVTVT
jgi:Right handed beta helix region